MDLYHRQEFFLVFVSNRNYRGYVELQLVAAFFLLGTVVGHVVGEAGGEGDRLLGLVGVVLRILLVVGHAQTVDVAGEGAEAALEG